MYLDISSRFQDIKMAWKTRWLQLLLCVMATADLTGAQGDCNFDSDLCSWTNSATDDFDWTKRTGTTSSQLTGPTADHTTGNGSYFYIEASKKTEGEEAVLQSADFNSTTTDQCMTFWYHMYGSDIGSLSVLVQPQGDNATTKVWELSGQQSNAWEKGQITVGMYNFTYKVLVVGVAGKSYLGDIAIDDISFNDSQCDVTPANADPNAATTTAIPTTTTTMVPTTTTMMTTTTTMMTTTTTPKNMAALVYPPEVTVMVTISVSVLLSRCVGLSLT